jgi:3-oxoacyl-[acyl-carrier protein] reductase
VFGVDRDAEALAETADLVAAEGGRFAGRAGDVTRGEEVARTVAACVERWGRVDVLVNNAGASQPKTLIEISEEEYDRTIAVTLKGCFNWCKAAAPAMLDRKRGRIINISSVSAHNGAGFCLLCCYDLYFLW